MRKRVKKLVSIALAFVLMFTLLPVFVHKAYAAEYWDDWTELSTTSGQTLSGNYKVTSSKTITNLSTGGNGLVINGIVTIYIESGCTLTVNGGAGSGTTGGGAGIRLPSGATLIVRGGGTIIANGGKAGNGATGQQGDTPTGGSNISRGIGTNKGVGGAGGGGAGAGIGAGGGNGGAGSTAMSSSVTNFGNNSNGIAGNTGGNGTAGGVGTGTLYVLNNITINATGGVAGSAGIAGSGGSQYTNSPYGAGGGGGGGAGGGGAAGIGIGGGSGGGGGGGNGAYGSVTGNTSSQSGAAGTGGGGGAPNATGGSGGVDGGGWGSKGKTANATTGGAGGDIHPVVASYAAAGGKGGNVGAGGNGGTVYKVPTATVNSYTGANASGGVGIASTINTSSPYTITYNANGTGVSNVPPSQPKYNNITEYITEIQPTRTYYNFIAWNTSSDGSGTPYNPSDNYAANANLTLFAQWEEITYTVTLHGNEGTGTDLVSYTYGEGATLPTDWTKEGSVFDGWYNNSELSGKAVTAIASNDTGNKIFWARWVSKTQTAVFDNTGSGDFKVQQQSNLDTVISRIVTPEDMVGNNSVTLSLNVSDIGEQNKEIEAIRGIANNTGEVYFFDVTLKKSVNDGSSTINTVLTNAPVPVEVHIKLEGDLADRTYYHVYRYHNGVAEQISSDPSKKEHYKVDVANSEIIIYTMKFSTYAIFGNDAPIDLDTGYDVDVQAKITGTGGAVYKIDLAWGAMTFEYSTANEWNPETHSYTPGTSVGWKNEGFMNGNNQITAWNHSNGDVSVSFEITDCTLNGTTIKINDSNELNGTEAKNMPLVMVQSEGGIVPYIDAFLWLNGEPDNVNSVLNGNYQKIAVIVATIEDAGGELTPNN